MTLFSSIKKKQQKISYSLKKKYICLILINYHPNSMNVTTTPIKGLLVIEPKIFQDERGFFMETYNKETFKEFIPHNFVQDNLSCSIKNVLRGLHFQLPPFAQAKLVTVIKGKAIDVVVDIRQNSPTYGQYYSIELSETNKKLFFISEGFAHGFIALENNTIFQYKCSNIYHQKSESGLMWNDKDININWHCDNPIISTKDTQNLNLINFNSPFIYA